MRRRERAAPNTSTLRPGSVGSGPSAGSDFRSFAMQRDRRERSRIDQRDTRAIVELDRDTSILRHWDRDVIHEPISRHSKVNDERIAGRKRKHLVFPAPFHALDARATKARDCTSGEMASLRAVQARAPRVPSFPATAALRTRAACSTSGSSGIPRSAAVDTLPHPGETPA